MLEANSKQYPERIMIIDDDPFSMMLSKLKLKKFVKEDNILEFFDIENALEFLDNKITKESAVIPDLILLEVMMNNAKGWDFISRFDDVMAKNGNTNVQLTILTSSQFFSDFRRASQISSIRGFLMKPVQTDLLLEIYRNARVSSYHAEQNLINSFIA